MMMLRSNLTATAGVLALGCAVLLGSLPAQALGLKDCSDKFSAAKTAGTLGAKSWVDFRKSDCGPDAKPLATPAAAAPSATAPAAAPAAPAKPAPAAAAATPAPAATPPAPTAKETRAEKRRAAKAAAPAAAATAPAAAAVPVGAAVFPTAIGEAHKTKKAAKARMATCLDQYRINKTTNGNGGLKWIQKGGGYYSECNKKLKA